jgi:hypothetical protein
MLAPDSSAKSSYSPATELQGMVELQRNAGSSSKKLFLSEMLSQISIINFLATVIIAGVVGLFTVFAANLSQRTITNRMDAPKSSDSFPEAFDTSPDHFIGASEGVEGVKNKIKEVNGQSAEEIKEALGIEQSIDLGGHGGTFKGRIEVDGAFRYLFLKPKDEVEYRNYQIIQRLAPEVAKFMPEVYGEIHIGEKSYIVMENIRINQEGEDLVQLADIKVSGKSEDDPYFNPIANQAEMMATRGLKKNLFDYWYMQLCSQSADDFMINKGEKYERLFNYSRSKELFMELLNSISLVGLKNLIGSMATLQRVMHQCPISFIGASITPVIDSKGNVRIVFVDPSHIQVRSSEKQRLPSDLQENTYFSDDEKYKESNFKGMGAIINAINEVKKAKYNVVSEVLAHAYNYCF